MTILKTEQAIIEQCDDKLELRIRIDSGGYAKIKPYSNDIRGLVGALTLAIDAIAGKLWIESIDTMKTDSPHDFAPHTRLESKTIKLLN